MLGSTFYHETMRKCVVGFGTLFNDIHITRKDSSGNTIQSMKVPLAYGAKQKFLARLTEDPSLNKSVAITLPRIGFEIGQIAYDPTRKLNKVQKVKKAGSSGNKVDTQYMPVPYNIDFELYCMSKNSDDALQIVEQILPYFQPSFSLTLNMIPDMNEKRDIAIILNGISGEDEWDDSFLERRYIAYSLQFTMKSYLYGPYNTADVIKKAIIHETIGDLDVNRRTITRTYTPKALTDINTDGVIDVNDDALVDAGDDFGFNEGIEFL